MDPKNFDLQQMMSSFFQNAQKMQEGLKSAYQEMLDKKQDVEVEGKAGGELVKAYVNLKIQVTRLEIKPEAYQEDAAVLNELIVSAINQAIHNAQQEVKKEMMNAGKTMGMPADFPMPWQNKGE